MRKMYSFLAMISFLVLVFEGCKQKTKESEGGEMFRGDKMHSGIYSSAPIHDPPSVKWKFKTNGVVNSSPAIAGEKIYFGSSDSNLYCLNADSGTLAWKLKTGGAVNSSPAISNGIVYFGSYDGNFYAVDAASGKIAWTFKTDGEKRFSAPGIHGALPKDSVFQDDWDFYLSSPVVDEGTVYFGIGSGFIYALDAATGTEKWKFKTLGVVHSSPAIAFGNVYVGSWDTYLYALNLKTGAEVWKFKTGIDTAIYNQTGITGSPLISDSILYFGCRDSHLYALNAINGNLIWKKFNDRGWISVSPVVYKDKLIYASGSSKYFVALSKKTGDSIYQLSIKTGVFSSPSIAGDEVYYGDMNGFLTARDCNSGKSVWTFQVDGSRQDPYKILNPDSSINGNAIADAVQSGNGKKGVMEIRLSVGTILSSPVIKNGVIYFGSTDGNLYALH